jgi:gamma-glutamyltranspeptidase/glutathione hydrolase
MFQVSEDLVRYMSYMGDSSSTFLVQDPLWAEDFAPNGTLVQLGDTITRKKYARWLHSIALGV